jgi:hypothetical protein
MDKNNANIKCCSCFNQYLVSFETVWVSSVQSLYVLNYPPVKWPNYTNMTFL